MLYIIDIKYQMLKLLYVNIAGYLIGYNNLYNYIKIIIVN